MNELEQKKKQIKNLQNEINEYNKNLHDTKQRLKDKMEECQSLCKESGTSVRSISEETVEQLKEENRLLVSELQSREQEIAALEDEVIKVLYSS
jgi:chromosome segregation ATPase